MPGQVIRTATIVSFFAVRPEHELQQSFLHIRKGMCFHFQSGMWLQDYGAAVSEPFVVTATGGERLSQVVRELIVID